MKKILAASAGALMLSAGLVATTSTAAHADPYPGTVQTTTTVTAPGTVQRKRSATVCASVTAGTATPGGTITITVVRSKNDKVIGVGTGPAPSFCYQTRKLVKSGGYTVTAKYTSPRGSVFTDSFGANGFDVVGGRGR